MTGGHSRLGANDRGSFPRGVTQDYDNGTSAGNYMDREPAVTRDGKPGIRDCAVQCIRVYTRGY